MLSRAMLLLALFLCGAAYADSYEVQIGAFRNPDATKIELPANVGELFRASGPNGLTRFVVGPFDNRVAADQAREKLVAAGFSGAFIRTSQDSYQTLQVNASTRATKTPEARAQMAPGKNEESDISQSDLEKFMSLSDEEREDVVFLDGQLHKKVGDEFVPLRD